MGFQHWQQIKILQILDSSNTECISQHSKMSVTWSFCFLSNTDSLWSPTLTWFALQLCPHCADSESRWKVQGFAARRDREPNVNANQTDFTILTTWTRRNLVCEFRRTSSSTSVRTYCRVHGWLSRWRMVVISASLMRLSWQSITLFKIVLRPPRLATTSGFFKATKTQMTTLCGHLEERFLSCLMSLPQTLK